MSAAVDRIVGTVPVDRMIPGIHALRGLAAVAVVLFHFTQLTPVPVPESLRFVANDFAEGVYLFFVLSAFALMHSTERHTGRPQWAKTFFIKRFWRIAPLFYLILVLVVCWRLTSGGVVDPWQVFLNLTFTTAFLPKDGMVPAGWTIGVEMLFYAIFPVLLLTVRTMRAAIVLSIVTMLATCADRILLFREYGSWANFMVPSNLCFFAFGILAYRIALSDHAASRRIRQIAPIVSLAAIIGLLLVPESYPLRGGAALIKIIWGLAFALLCTWRGVAKSHRGNPLMHYLGERSYSIYLLHPLVIWLLRSRLQNLYSMLVPIVGGLGGWCVCVAILLAVLLVGCEATYRMVELPGIQMGGWVNRRRQSQDTCGMP
ncbi:acyltransferase family protein [Rhodanobacter geophilus]|uniref:Acyltransferase family protein n=1 Tax=Rhodanobacter geophilus TaxID=3162488 RepID=A0ABV3QNR7_9GAMM